MSCSSSEIEEQHGEHGGAELSANEFFFAWVPLSDTIRLTSQCTAFEIKENEIATGKHYSIAKIFIKT